MLPAGRALAQGQAITPESSIQQPGDVGVSAHTNVKFFVPDDGTANLAPPDLWSGGANPLLPPFSGTLYHTPASLGCVYKLTTTTTGCNPNVVTANPTGGSRAIAIVDAYNYTTAAVDLAAFSRQFGLPAPTAANFQVVYANGVPATNSGWNLEEALDIEIAHAMAPSAKIYLVIAKSNSFTDLLAAVAKANSLLTSGGEVSMSWGGSEFSSESSNDGNFKKSGVVYFASAGDSPGVSWPSASPYVVSVGGTGLSYNLSTDTFQEEIIWGSTGGGPSAVYARPSYQLSVSGVTGPHRGTPDVAADADPKTGVWVYCSAASCGSGPWWIVGGTSVASPTWAGIVNSAGHFSASTSIELTTIYANKTVTTAFRDITDGFCGPYDGDLGLVGYDLCTGVGSPQGKTFK
jgi:subtilase family serine protease